MGRTRLRGLSIAGIQIGIEVPEPCEWAWPESEVADYVCLPREPEIHVGLRIGALPPGELGGERHVLGAATFEIARRGTDWLIGLSRSGRPRQIAHFDREFRIGEIVQDPEWARERRYPLAGGLDEWLVLQRTIARGGLCLTGRAVATAGGAVIRVGAVASADSRGWRVATPTLLGRETLVLREEGGALRVHRTPWCGAMDESLGRDARVVEFETEDPALTPFREVVDPGEAAELLVAHAVLPLTDERFLDRVLGNASRLAARSRLVRLGVTGDAAAAPARAPRSLPSVLTTLGLFA
jgi:hypothetical protein